MHGKITGTSIADKSHHIMRMATTLTIPTFIILDAIVRSSDVDTMAAL